MKIAGFIMGAALLIAGNDVFAQQPSITVKAGTKIIDYFPSEKFFFSVKNDSLAARLDTLQGQMVIVHYRQKNAPVFWRGDSPYLVDGVKNK